MNYHLSIKSYFLVGAMAIGAVSLVQLDTISRAAGASINLFSMSACPQAPGNVIGSMPSRFCDEGMETAYISHKGNKVAALTH